MRAQVLAGLLLTASAGFSQHGSSQGARIDQSTEGAQIFRAQCAGCHGLDGSGTGAGPALNRGTFRRGSTDDAIVATVSKGVAGTTMPAFSFDARQMPQVVAHIRALAIVRAAGSVTGDIAQGRTLFAAHCNGCHSSAAPDLANIAARLSAAELRTAMLDPGASVSSEHWTVVARLHSGQTVEGTRLNEDTSSIQLRERSGKLRSLLKQDLASFELVRKSPMPSFRSRLSDAQLDSVVAYLIRGQQQ
jgi:putative heme-binding domain-containing protein